MKAINTIFYTILFASVLTVSTHSSMHAMFTSNSDKCALLVGSTPALPVAGQIQAGTLLQAVKTASDEALQTLKVLIAIHEKYSATNITDHARLLINNKLIELHRLCNEIATWSNNAANLGAIQAASPTTHNMLNAIKIITATLDQAKQAQPAALFSFFTCKKDVIKSLKLQVTIVFPDTSFKTKASQWIKPKILPALFLLSAAALWYYDPKFVLVKSIPGHVRNIYQNPYGTLTHVYKNCSETGALLLKTLRKAIVKKLNY